MDRSCFGHFLLQISGTVTIKKRSGGQRYEKKNLSSSDDNSGYFRGYDRMQQFRQHKGIFL